MSKLLILFLSLTLAFPLAGCWDMIDIEKEGFITTIGIDLPQEPGSQIQLTSPVAAREKVRVSMEIFSPRLADLKKDRTNVIVVQEASSLGEAIRLAQGKFSRRLSLEHLRSVVIGEDYARQGIDDILEALERDPRVAYRFRLSFVQGRTAEEVLNMPIVSEKNVSQILTRLGDKDPAYSFHRTLNVSELHETLKVTGGTAYATRNILDENDWLMKSGAAIIHKWKLIGWLTPFETRSTNWLTSEVDMATLAIDDGELAFTCNVHTAKSKITPLYDDNQPGFRIKISCQGQVTELLRGPRQFDLALLAQMEQLVAQIIRDEAMLALQLSQKEYRADYLGLGQHFFNKYPQLYRSLDWEEIYPDVPVEVEVDVKLPRIGAKT